MSKRRAVKIERNASPTLSRRRLLLGGVGLGAAWGLRNSLVARAASVAPSGHGSLGDIEHLVFLIQENRSFDHYFGTLRGVRGFDDRRTPRNVFQQAWPQGTDHTPPNVLLPFHLDQSTSAGACVHDVTHSWSAQHRCLNDGRMDQWATTHCHDDGPDAGPATMGYLTRDDLAFYYALADTFTICDNYFCSVLGPTHPNRLYSMSATTDPDGQAGGPIVDNSAAAGSLKWTTMPERLETAGVSWNVYQFAASGPLNFGDSILNLFAAYQDPSTPLYQKGMLPTFPGDFERDCLLGTLPQVSWLLAPPDMDEHPSGPPTYGEAVCAQALRALTANPDVWAKTALFVTYDENGGFFDHVAPPRPPTATPGEWITTSTLPKAADGIPGPVGFGFRVPCLVVSPFSRGGWVCSEAFDHTSMLRLIERRFGVEVPNLSDWRRNAAGDLTATLDMGHPVSSMPALPDTVAPAAAASLTCTPTYPQVLTGQDVATYPVPTSQQMPNQEPGTRPHRR
jgi:phospholipase C